jgi:hypothetical protein
MPRLRTDAAKNALFAQARATLQEAAGDNGVLSKAEQKTLPEDYATAAEYARDAKRAAGERATVDVDDVMNNYASYVHRVVGAVNTKGEAFISSAEQASIYDDKLRGRLADIRAGGVQTTLSAKEREHKAVEHLLANVESGTNVDATYPALDSGEMGLIPYFAEGDAAARLAAFANAWYGKPAALKDFDPATHSMIAARVTEDEESLFVAVMDRKTGEVTVIGEMDVVDLAYCDISQAQLEAIVGPISRFGATEIDEIDHYDLIDALVEGSKQLDVGYGDKVMGYKLDDAFEDAVSLPGGEVLMYMSEGDYEYKFTQVKNPGDKAIDGELILDRFADTIFDELFEGHTDRSEVTFELASNAETLDMMRESQPWSGADAAEIAETEAYNAMYKLMKDNLTDLRFIRIGPKDDDGTMADDQGLYAHLIVGRTADGHLGAMYYGSVET